MHLKKAITQNILWRGLYLVSSFVVNVLISRLLNADKSGGVFYIVNNLAFIILITSLSLETGTAFYLAKRQITPYKAANFSILYSTIAAAVCVAIFKIIFPKLIGNDKTILLFFYVCGIMLVSFFNAFFSALQNFRLPNIVLILTNVILIFCFFLFKNSPILKHQFYYFYFGAFALQGIFLSLVFMLNYRKVEQKTNQINDVINLIFKYSLMAISANIIYFLLNRVDYWFVNKYCSLSDLGNYIQASKLGQIFVSIPGIVGASVFAWVAGETKGHSSKNVLMICRAILYIAVLAMLALIFIGKWLFPFLFGNSFNKMYEAFVLLSPGFLAVCFLYPLAAYYSGIKKIKVNISGSVLALIVVVVGDFIFIPNYGIFAAATISSIGYITYAIYVTCVFCKQNNISFISVFKIKKADFNWLLNKNSEV